MKRVVLAACCVVACTRAPSPAPVDAPPPATTAPPLTAPPLDAAKVLAILAENAPSVQVSIVGGGRDVVLELHGGGGASIAIAQLSSLPERLPGARVSKLRFDDDAWSATVALAGVAPSDSTALTTVLSVLRPVLTGDSALLATAIVDVTADRMTLTGAFLPGRTIADAAVVGPALRKAEAGPPVVIEIASALPTP